MKQCAKRLTCGSVPLLPFIPQNYCSNFFQAKSMSYSKGKSSNIPFFLPRQVQEVIDYSSLSRKEVPAASPRSIQDICIDNSIRVYFPGEMVYMSNIKLGYGQSGQKFPLLDHPRKNRVIVNHCFQDFIAPSVL